jgi:type IV secretion system protein VirD4
VVRDFATIAHRSENTHSGIKDQLMTALAPLANPLVRFATAANSFDVRELRSESMSIYLVVARPDVPALRPLLNLFVQQLVDLNTTVELRQDPSHRHEVLLAMDEFAQVGRLDAIFHGITFFRSFGLRLLAIMQSPSQLREIYSQDGAATFERSFDCSVYFTPASRDLETAENLSRLLGNDTVKGKSKSVRVGLFSDGASQTESDQRRALLLPQEVARLPLDKEVVLVSGSRPIYAEKIRIWEEPIFTARYGSPPLAPQIQLPDSPLHNHNGSTRQGESNSSGYPQRASSTGDLSPPPGETNRNPLLQASEEQRGELRRRFLAARQK